VECQGWRMRGAVAIPAATRPPPARSPSEPEPVISIPRKGAYRIEGNETERESGGRDPRSHPNSARSAEQEEKAVRAFTRWPW